MTFLKQRILMIMVLLLIPIGSGGCLSLLQPISKTQKEFNFVDMNAPALRLAQPVEAYLLRKDENGKWVEAGRGIIPAGAYIKGRKPDEKVVE